MTPDELALEVLLPAIAAAGRTSREPQTIAQLLEHREPSFGHELDIELQAGMDWLVTHGFVTRDPTQSGNFLTLTRKGRERARDQR
jgi:hypothetical protein